jgi:RNA polymerase sigma factor (sigma-70 family)
MTDADVVDTEVLDELEEFIELQDELNEEVEEENLDENTEVEKEEQQQEIVEVIVIPFEEDYEDVKTDPNFIWFKYEDKIRKIINGLSYWKNFDGEELIQQAYIYFVDFCKIYDPYYNGNFIPFDKFLFKNLIIKLRAYIQRYYFKVKREQPTEFSEYVSHHSAKNNILDIEDKLYSDYLYSLISDRQKEILKLSIEGYKQQEIGEILDISQSRVSVIKKKTLNKLNDILENNGKVKKKSRKF